MIRQYWSPVAASSSAKNGSLRSTSEGRSSSLSSSSSSPWYKTTNKTDWWNLTAWGNLINVFNESCVTDCAEWCRTQIVNMGTSRCIHLCVPPDCVAVLTWFLWDFFCFFRSFFLSRKSSQGVSWSFPSNFFFTSCSVVSFSPARTVIKLLSTYFPISMFFFAFWYLYLGKNERAPDNNNNNGGQCLVSAAEL